MTTPIESTAAAADEMSFEIYDCKSGEYNPLASLWFTSAEMTLKHLFVREAPYALGYGPLIVFSILYYVLACFTAGTWIAAGLLVPMLIMGASFGRLFGVILNSIFPAAGLDPGIYSLLGATGNFFPAIFISLKFWSTKVKLFSRQFFYIRNFFSM